MLAPKTSPVTKGDLQHVQEKLDELFDALHESKRDLMQHFAAKRDAIRRHSHFGNSNDERQSG